MSISPLSSYAPSFSQKAASPSDALNPLKGEITRMSPQDIVDISSEVRAKLATAASPHGMAPLILPNRDNFALLSKELSPKISAFLEKNGAKKEDTEIKINQNGELRVFTKGSRNEKLEAALEANRGLYESVKTVLAIGDFLKGAEQATPFAEAMAAAKTPSEQEAAAARYEGMAKRYRMPPVMSFDSDGKVKIS